MRKHAYQIQSCVGAVMIEILDRISELRELQALYHEGELRNYDFEAKIQTLEQQVEKFEAEYDIFDD
jgi:hypothetical protein